VADLAQLRNDARAIFEAAIQAVDAGAAVKKAIRLDHARLIVRDRQIELYGRRIYSIAIGKAAVPLARALEEQLGSTFAEGVITAPNISETAGESSDALSSRWRRFAGGHPLPNEESLRAARSALALLDQANAEGAAIIFLISGGGSAMLERPVRDDITLADLRTANEILVNCGASISEINSVRRAFSAVKGGKLAARAPHCEQITLIVSDVPKGEECMVASGPTVAVPNSFPNPLQVVEKYRLKEKLPSAIVRAVETEAAAPALAQTAHEPLLLLDNDSALKAAARAAASRGFVFEIAEDIADQPIEEGCRLLLERWAALQTRHRGGARTVCLICGGEFSCPVRGDGIGGRNLETALRIALSTANHDSERFVALCAGTDGIDGNSPVAGAIIDNATIDRAKAIGLDAEDFLRRSDAYSFFHALGDDVFTGLTGTNVRDVRILMALS
jgi:glycerate 2-kinase